jgi:hypothetical protein
MKNYTIPKKKIKERNEKIEVKTSNAFLSLKMRFFALKMAVTTYVVNHVDLIVNFPWQRSTTQSEFSIKC